MTYVSRIPHAAEHESTCNYYRSFGGEPCTCDSLLAQLQRLQSATYRILNHADGSPNANLEAMLVAQALLDDQHSDHGDAIRLASEWVREDIVSPRVSVPHSGELRTGTPTGHD
jgi:hypothetical protein